MKHSDKLYQIAFSQLYGIGPVRARRILKLLTHPRDFFETGFKELQQLTSIPISQLEKTDRASALLRAQGQLPYLENEQLSYHFITDTTYPERLRHCTDAPLGLISEVKHIVGKNSAASRWSEPDNKAPMAKK